MMIAPPLRQWPRFWRTPSLLHSHFPTAAVSSTSKPLQSHLVVISPSHPSFSSSSHPLRSLASQTQALRRTWSSSPTHPYATEDNYDEEVVDPDGNVEKSRNQKKREARRAVSWGMDIAEFPPAQIKRILRVASLDDDVYDAIMLAKRLGPDVREGKRRQFGYIGKLLRDAKPELMDALIQASKDNDNSKLQALAIQEDEMWTDEDDDLEEDESEELQINNETVNRWFDGLIQKDASISSEVYSIHNVDFDRQELRKLVRAVQSIDEAESMALTKAKYSLLHFLRKLAKHMLIS